MNKLKIFSAIAILAVAITDKKAVLAQDAPFVLDPHLSEQKQDVVKPFSYFL